MNVVVWFAFAGVLIFYLINLLRYSKEGTIFAGSLSIFVFYAVTLHFNVPPIIIFQVSIAFFIVLLIGYSVTISNKKMMIEANTKKMMERYLAPELVNDLYHLDANLEPGGETQKVSILFSDIRSFTTIAESMPPEQVVSLLNEYLSLMTNVIFEQKGTIDKFIGDAIMTIFGAPIRGEDDAQRAVATALAMHRALKLFNKKHKILREPLQIGIGIHTGEVIVGNIGSEKRLDYTVIGDNVNLSSRIEQLTSYYGCPILISDSTYHEVASLKEAFAIREIDRVVVKGKVKNTTIYEVLAFDSEEERLEIIKKIDTFELALALYRKRNFAGAIAEFEKLSGDSPSQIYLKRSKSYLQNPPLENWDGTFVMLRK